MPGDQGTLRECCQITWHIPRLHRPLFPPNFACRPSQDQWNKLCTPSFTASTSTWQRMCGTRTYFAINWLLPHSSKTLSGGVIPQTLSRTARRVWGPDYSGPNEVSAISYGCPLFRGVRKAGFHCSIFIHTLVIFSHASEVINVKGQKCDKWSLLNYSF